MEELKTRVFGTPRNAIRRNAGLLLLFILLDVILIASNWAPTAAAAPTLVGIVREPSAYCAFAQVDRNGSGYRIVTQDGYEALLRALDRGELDAALLPVPYLAQLDPDEYDVVAVTSALNLAAVGSGASVYALGDLNGRAVVVPESLRDSRAMRMMDLLISETDTDVQIRYQADDMILRRAPENGDEILLLTPEQSAELLLLNKDYQSCFGIANQWEVLMGTQPPAGSCVVARKTDAGANALEGFLSDIRASIAFLNSKHKKAATLITASGLSQDAVFVWKVLPFCAFRYLEGEDMAQSLGWF